MTEHFYSTAGSGPGAGRLFSIVDPNGNAMYLEWSGDQLLSVTDTLGRVYTLGYSSGRIVSLTDFAGRTVTYDYYTATDTGGATGDLKSVTSPAVTGTITGNNFPSGKTTTYTYTRGYSDDQLNHAMLSIRDPSGVVYLQNTFEVAADGLGHYYQRVERQFFGSGDFKYTYVSDLDAERPERRNAQDDRQ